MSRKSLFLYISKKKGFTLSNMTRTIIPPNDILFKKLDGDAAREPPCLKAIAATTMVTKT